MSLLREYIRMQIKEGQIERSKLTLPDVVNKLKNKVLIFFDTETT